MLRVRRRGRLRSDQREPWHTRGRRSYEVPSALYARGSTYASHLPPHTTAVPCMRQPSGLGVPRLGRSCRTVVCLAKKSCRKDEVVLYRAGSTRGAATREAFARVELSMALRNWGEMFEPAGMRGESRDEAVPYKYLHIRTNFAYSRKIFRPKL